jgi:hypothetical protein
MTHLPHRSASVVMRRVIDTGLAVRHFYSGGYDLLLAPFEVR